MTNKDLNCPHCGMDMNETCEMSETPSGAGGWSELLAMAVIFPLVFIGAGLWKAESLAGLADERLVFAIGLSLVIFAGIAIQTGLGRLMGRLK